ncbi:lysozyme-like domain-containing protein [Fennellomyces sp. T-0311]|nr:lysozyme-like domain-containing protein [Fennellomyces sp. T-0311]
MDMTDGTDTYYDLSGLPQVDSVDPRVVKIASLVTNVFEYGDKNVGYAGCEDIGDMRGFTCGFVGFTTGTNDADQLLREYAEFMPSNSLVPYLSRLGELSRLNSCDVSRRASTSGLETFCNAWREEACHPDLSFATFQRQWTFDNYLIPSVRFATAMGVLSPLGQLIFYDTIIQHGYQFVEPRINLVRILELTGTRVANESEQSYLTRFLTTRRSMQCCFPDSVWPVSAIRSMDLQELVSSYDVHWNLSSPITLLRFNQVVTGDESIENDKKRCPVVP